MTGPRVETTPLYEEYLRLKQQSEAKPTTPLYEEYLRSQGKSGDVDLRQASESTSVTPRATAPEQDGAAEGVLDAGLNQLTFGLHQKGLGVTDALIDLATHGTNAHPIDTYNASTQGTRNRINAAGEQHPLAKTAAEAAGFFAPLAVEAPVRALLGLPEAVAAARAPGVGNALKRIGKNTVAGGTLGAAMTGTSSDGPLEDRPSQMLGGGALGALLGGGATSAAEGLTGAKSVLGKLFQSGESKGSQAARERISTALAADGLAPDDLLTNAQKAIQTGSPALSAHLGGPALDDLTYLGGTSSGSGSRLKEALRASQRGERDVLQRGVTAMSGVPHTPENQADRFLSGIDEARSAAGAEDYPKAYNVPPVDDPRVLNAIANEPYLSKALDQSVDILGRRSRADALRTGDPAANIVHPLRETDEAVGRGQGAQLAVMYKDDPVMHALARKAAGLPELQGGASGAIPVQMLDKLKQAAQPGIELGLKRGHLAAEDANSINDQIQSVLRMVDETRPDYARARQRQAGFFQQEEAGKLGKKAFDQSPEVIAAQRADLTPGQEPAYRTTSTSMLRQMLDDKRYGANLSQGLFDNPAIQGQLRSLYGADATKIDPYLEQGNTLNRVLESATGNSKTAPRQALQESVKSAGGTDVARALAKPRRSVINLPGKFLDAHEQRIRDALTETLAKELNIPADSPDLAGLVERLSQSVNRGNFPPNMLWKGPTEAVNLGLSGRLAAAMAGGGQ